MLLGFTVEKVTGQRLDEFFKDTYLEPLGLKHVTFNPLENGFSKEDCATTELNGNTRDGVISFENVRTNTVQVRSMTRSPSMPWEASPVMPACLPMRATLPS